MKPPARSAPPSLGAVLRRNIATNYTSMLVNGAIGFFLAPFLVHSLGDEAYGLWVLVGSLVGHLGLMQHGVGRAIAPAIAERSARNDREGLAEVFGTALGVLGAVAVVIVLAAAGLAFSLERWFAIPPGRLVQVRWLVLGVGLSLAGEAVASVFRGGLAGVQRYDLTALLDSAGMALQAATFVLLLRLGFDLATLGAATLGVTALTTTWAWRLMRRQFPGVPLSPARGSRQALRRVGSFSLKTLVVAAAVRLNYYSDAAVIAWGIGAAAVTHFAVASRLVEYARQCALVMGTGLVPAASALAAAGEGTRQRRLLLRGTRYMALVAFPLLAVLLVAGGSLLRVWMGPAYASSAMVLRLLALAQVAALVVAPTAQMLYGVNRPGIVALAAACEGLANLLLSVLLVRRLGILGVALGTALPVLLVQPSLWVYSLRRVFGLRVRDVLRQALRDPLLASVPFALALALLDGWFAPASRGPFFLVVTGAGLISLPGFWLLGLHAEEREEAWAWLRGRLTWRPARRLLFLAGAAEPAPARAVAGVERRGK